jgi:hypothetical protein
LVLEYFKELLGVQAPGEFLRLNLAAPVQTAPWTSHDFHIIVLALPSLDVPDNVLYISEAVSGSKSKNRFAVNLQKTLLDIFVLALDKLERFSRINRDTKDFFGSSPEDVLKITIRGGV